MSGYTYSRFFTDEEIMADMERHCEAEERKWAEYERRKKVLPLMEPGEYEKAIKGICEELSL